MNIEKAIEINTKLERTLAPTMRADGTDAIKLGIEALKKRMVLRDAVRLIPYEPLPGETED